MTFGNGAPPSTAGGIGSAASYLWRTDQLTTVLDFEGSLALARVVNAFRYKILRQSFPIKSPRSYELRSAIEVENLLFPEITSEPAPNLMLLRETLRLTRMQGENSRKALLHPYAGDTTLGELAYCIVRNTKPHLILETGVATGVTSAYVLAAIADNRIGRLISIDLPRASWLLKGWVGSAVPSPLRAPWTYIPGDATVQLPLLLADLNQSIGLFIHDSNHSYEHMLWEFETVWPFISDNGYVLSDDVDGNDALTDFSHAHNLRFHTFCQISKPGVGAVFQRHG